MGRENQTSKQWRLLLIILMSIWTFLHGREKPATDYDDGLKLLDEELAKMLSELPADDIEVVRALVKRKVLIYQGLLR